MRFQCLQCHEFAETTDVTTGARWLANSEPLPCGHADADFEANPELRVAAERPAVRGSLPN